MSRLLSVFKDLVCLFLGYFLVGNFIWVFFCFCFLRETSFWKLVARFIYWSLPRKKNQVRCSLVPFSVLFVFTSPLSLFFFFLFVCPSVCPSVCVSVCLSVTLSRRFGFLVKSQQQNLVPRLGLGRNSKPPPPPSPAPFCVCLRVCVCVCRILKNKQSDYF